MQTTSIRANLIGLSFTVVLIEDDGPTLAIIGSDVPMIDCPAAVNDSQLLQLAQFGSLAGENLKPGERIIAQPYTTAIDKEGKLLSLDTFLPSGTKVTWWVGLDDEGIYRYFGFDQSDKAIAFRLTNLDVGYDEPDMVHVDHLNPNDLRRVGFDLQTINAIHTASKQGRPTFSNRPSTQGQA